MKRSQLKKQLQGDEGVRLKPYKDTVGKLTIGVGRNLDDVGISAEEADYMLDNDINGIVAQLTAKVACFGSLDDARQHVLIDMGFMGVGKLLQFTKMLAAVERRDWDQAAKEMLDSRWATQVGDRAQRLARQMREGA